MISDFSGATIVIFIALGSLVLVLLFIFAKRQIMRFTLRSRRGPHVPIGHSAPRVGLIHVCLLICGTFK